MPCKSKFPLKILIDAKLHIALHFRALISVEVRLIIIMHFTIRQLSVLCPVPNRINSEAFNLPGIWQNSLDGGKRERTSMPHAGFTQVTFLFKLSNTVHPVSSMFNI
jgi:hypothetical protein